MCDSATLQGYIRAFADPPNLLVISFARPAAVCPPVRVAHSRHHEAGPRDRSRCDAGSMGCFVPRPRLTL